MTIAIAWVAERKNGRRYLYIASDSRTRGGMVLDCCPKILTLPRSDCAICFAGNTAATYPLMMQLANAIAAHSPAQERSLDIAKVKGHLLRVLSDIVASIQDAADPIRKSDVQFIFAGYSWRTKGYAIWTIEYSEVERKFSARPARSFHTRIPQAAFIGDVGRKFRSKLIRRLDNPLPKDGDHPEYVPLALLRDELRLADSESTIGGPPQLVRVAEHMNTRILAVRWTIKGGAGPQVVPTVLGRPLFDYENVDYWTLDPDTFHASRPRSFGHRDDESLQTNEK